MNGTSIAANVRPGADGKFGSFGGGNDDVVISPNLEGAIKSITVKTASGLSGSGDGSEHFSIVAHRAIGPVTIGRAVNKSPNWPGLENLRIIDNIL